MENARILIVEDESIVAKDLAQRLQSMGHTVLGIAASGAAAVQQAVETRPNLVLMDIHLRGAMDGIEAAAQIHAQHDIPFIYLTAYADEATLERAKVTEPFGYILKPFEERELQVTLEVALYKHRMEKALEQQRVEFLATLIHDIKSPLSVILGYADILTEEVRARGLTALENLLGKMQSNVFTVHSLLANYLQLSTIEAGHLRLAKKPLAINDIMQHVVWQYDTEARLRHLSLELRLQDDLPLMECDPLALERVFANLLSNALKFTPEGGAVTLSSVQRGGMVVAAVTDTGPGIAREEIPLMFEKYRRSVRDQHHTGTGLGLFIVKSIVEAHEGRVEVESALGVGTCFSVCLPVASPEVLETVEAKNKALRQQLAGSSHGMTREP
jgi:signal transduction histidine kinase